MSPSGPESAAEGRPACRGSTRVVYGDDQAGPRGLPLRSGTSGATPTIPGVALALTRPRSPVAPAGPIDPPPSAHACRKDTVHQEVERHIVQGKYELANETLAFLSDAP